MKQVVLAAPPNPDDSRYKGNILAYNRAMYQWATHMKGILEQESSVNNIPMDQPMVINSYTLTTSISGTSTGTDIANFVATLAATMTRRGLISPHNQGGNS